MIITLAEIVEKWGLSKATVYRAIQMGKLHKDDDGLIDVSHVVQLWGEPNAKKMNKKSKNQSKTVKIDNERERELLAKVKSLQEALDKAEADKTWLQQQVEANQQVIKLLEFKTTQLPPSLAPKKGLFGRIIKAINNE
jgi:septal ring factor EnvC (AmiA/AmiB activator)